MTIASEKFIQDCRRYLALSESRASEGKMAGAISAAWQAHVSAHDLAVALESDRAQASNAKRAALDQAKRAAK